MRLTTVLSLAGSLACITSAGAASISYSGTTLTMTGAAGTTSAAGSLPRFNPAFGTLTAVLFQVSDSTSVTHRYENLTSVPASAGSSETVVTILFDGLTTLASATGGGSHTGGATTTFDGTIDFGGTGGFTAQPATYAASGMGLGIPALYQGAGSFGVTIQRTASEAAVTSPGGFVVPSNSASSTVNYMVTYTFDPIPEPGSASLAGLAAAAVLMRRRRN